jgi:hypothetical protein
VAGLSGPVGWAAVGLGVLGSIAASFAYNNNIFGIKDISDTVGKNIDKTLNNIGHAFSSGWGKFSSAFGG